LQIDFHWRCDRFHQTISLVGQKADVMPLLASVEGDAGASWPPSPPLQSLSIESLPDGRRAALLVGMAGRGHWSASIEALPHETALLFDIACRMREPAAALASTYRMAAEGGALFAAADRSWIEVRHGKTAAVITPSQESAAGSTLTLLDPATFAISPSRPHGSTIRWKYRVELVPVEES
jgi:hypothetical protein